MVPANLKIYHIIHIDRLPSVIADDYLWCDDIMVNRPGTGTPIGMNAIKSRRLYELTLSSHPDLYVGQCVPFYFCPRSVMLYLIYQGNHPDLEYKGGQGPIIHLEADLGDSIKWAERNNLRWAFTLSNAGSYYFEDRCDLKKLKEINWQAVQERSWSHCKEPKQAELLIENNFHWTMISRIGVISPNLYSKVSQCLASSKHKPPIAIEREWYY